MSLFHSTRQASYFLSLMMALLSIPQITMAARYENRLDFSLLFGSHTSQWMYKGERRETRLRHVTASWSQPLSHMVRGGLQIAYLDMSQAEHPQDVGLSSSGDSLGIDLQLYLVNTARFWLGLRFAYDYARTENKLDAERIENDWSTASLGLDSRLGLGKQLQLLAGVSQVTIDGEEHLSGSQNQLTPFSEETSMAYYAGLRFRTDNRGYIGLRAYGGYSEGIQLSFTRLY